MEEKRPGFWSDRGVLYLAATVAAGLEVAAEDSPVCLLPSSFSVASVV